jgi:dTDP-D-glucose 4,6-dehydratase
MKLLITGGAGFIGSNFILDRIEKGDKVLNLDKLTYSGNLDNLISVQDNWRCCVCIFMGCPIRRLQGKWIVRLPG